MTARLVGSSLVVVEERFSSSAVFSDGLRSRLTAAGAVSALGSCLTTSGAKLTLPLGEMTLEPEARADFIAPPALGETRGDLDSSGASTLICSWSKSFSEAVGALSAAPPPSLWEEDERRCFSLLSFFLFLSFLCLGSASSLLSLDTPEL